MLVYQRVVSPNKKDRDPGRCNSSTSTFFKKLRKSLPEIGIFRSS